MARTRAVSIGILVMTGLVVAQPAPVSVTLTWLGQATFVMTTSTGATLLLDPTNPGAYRPAPVDGIDAVTITHDHPDHTYVQMATGSPTVIRGLKPEGFAVVDQTIKGVRVRTVPAFHDSQQGAQRGRNALFVYEMPGLKIAHLGDLGHKLDPQQVSAIGPVDIVMTPIAGGPTMDARTALEVIDQLSAKVVIPMHYATAALTARVGQGPDGAARAAGPPPASGGVGRGAFSMTGVDDFLKLLDASVKVEQAGHQVTLLAGRLPAQRTVLVMDYQAEVPAPAAQAAGQPPTSAATSRTRPFPAPTTASRDWRRSPCSAPASAVCRTSARTGISTGASSAAWRSRGSTGTSKATRGPR